MRPWAFLGALALGALLVPGAAFPQPQPIIEVTPLPGGLHRLSWDEGTYTVNMVASIGDDGTLLVDTGEESTAEALRATLARIGGGDPVIIINTHAHVDHTGGNAIFEGRSVIIAHDILRTRLQSGDYVFFEFTDATLPTVTFRDSLSVYFNGERIRVIAVPGSHTDNDVIVHFTKSGVACMGDLCYGQDFPSWDLVSGDILRYGEAVQRAIDLLPDDVTLVSGHGRNCTMAEYREFHEMLVRTTATIRERVAAGATLSDLQNSDVLSEWESFGTGYVGTNLWIRGLVEGIDNPGPKKSPLEELYPFVKAGDMAGAMARYDELKRDHPREYALKPVKFYVMGLYLTKHGRHEDAALIYERCLEEFPDWGFAWFMYDLLGGAYRDSGDREHAAAAFRKALELNPEDTESADALKALGEESGKGD